MNRTLHHALLALVHPLPALPDRHLCLHFPGGVAYTYLGYAGREAVSGERALSRKGWSHSHWWQRQPSYRGWWRGCESVPGLRWRDSRSVWIPARTCCWTCAQRPTSTAIKAVSTALHTAINRKFEQAGITIAFIALALGSSEGSSSVLALKLVIQELGIGLIVGLGLTTIGTWLLKWCMNRGWVTDIWMQVTAVALAIACFAVAQSLHGSGYIAAFTGGLLFGFKVKGATHQLVLTAEGTGETLALMTWMLFGAVVIGQSVQHFTWEMLIYALLSLTVIRMLPIFLSLAGTGESPASKLFLGWFGPRGLASIVFAIIVINQGVAGGEFVAMVVVLTVFFSLVAHGISANPLSELFGQKEGGK